MSWACIIPKLSSLLRSVEKLSSMKPVSGAIKVGDHWSRNHIRAWGQAAIWERDKRTWDFDLEQEEVPRASISETVTSWCVCVQGIGLALAPLSSIALVCPLSAWSVKSLAWVLPSFFYRLLGGKWAGDIYLQKSACRGIPEEWSLGHKCHCMYHVDG